MANTSITSSSNGFQLLRNLSLTIFVTMLVTAASITFLFYQNQASEIAHFAEVINHKNLLLLTQSLDDQIDAFISESAEGKTGNQSILDMDALFDAELNQINGNSILKIKLYDAAGKTVYSSAKSEIGGTTAHPDWLVMALKGGTRFGMEYREVFSVINGELYNVDIAITYMPLSHAGRQIGVIEVYDDYRPQLNRLYSYTIRIALIVFGAFLTMYAVLFASVFRMDRAVTGWQKNIIENKHILRLSEEKFRSIFELANDGIEIISMEGQIIDLNHVSFESLGFEKSQMQGKYLSDFVVPEYGALIPERLALTKAQGTAIYESARVNNAGLIVSVEVKSRLIEIDGQQVFLSVVRDITQRKKSEEEIRNLAFYDPLTQLPNRRLLYDRLGQAMVATERSGRYAGLMVLDLDNFKLLNDIYGHMAGDQLLLEAASRLKGCVRDLDTVSRFGGDEFVVVLGELDMDRTESSTQARHVAEKIRLSLARPFVLTIRNEKNETVTIAHQCTASIGVIVFVGHEKMPGDYIKWADTAMYQSKELGRNQIQFYRVS